MGKANFTADRVSGFKCARGKQQTIHWDDKTPGFGLRVTASGAKSYIFESRLHGKTLRLTIGSPKTWPLETQWRTDKDTGERVEFRRGAREEAQRLRALTDQGIDPRELVLERKASAEAKQVALVAAEHRKHLTLRALMDVYVQMLIARGKTKSALDVKSATNCHIAPNREIAGTPACEVTSHQIAALVRKVQEAGKERTAGQLRTFILAAYNAARKAPFDATLPAELISFNIEANPADVIPSIPVRAGTRTLSADELKPYMERLGKGRLDVALRLALLAGGQRMAQLVRVRVSDFDPTSHTLRLWDGKGKRKNPREHLLPLADGAADLVAQLVERASKREDIAAKKQKRKPVYTNLWLFSTSGKKQLLETTTGRRLTVISKDMKGEPFHVSDIRRTCETMLAGMGISKDTRAQLLSHGISGVQSTHYDKYAYIEEKRAALVAWEARLSEIAAGTKLAGNVVNLHAKGKAA